MPDNDQRRRVEARGADHHSGAVRGSGVRIGRTAVTGWALASVLVVAGFGTAMGATPVAVAQPVAVADTTDTTGSSTGTVGLDPLALLPTADPVSPSAVLQDLPTIGPAPSPPATETAAPQPGAVVGAPAAEAQLRQAEFTTDAPDVRAAAAIRTALAQIGLPYVWGGNGPTNGDAGFDCSGLTTFSYASAGVSLPRTAHTQYNTGPHVPDGAPLQPGDLVFYGTTARVHHVGMYLGAGRMVNAPTFGKPVQVAFYRYPGDDYLGATRPAAAPGSLTSGILPFVDPATLPAVPRSAPEQVFTAPTAPMVALPQPGDPTLPPEQVSAAQSLQEANAVSVARSAAVAGASASTSAPVTTEPAAVGIETTGTATGTTTGTATGVATSTTAPVTSTPTTATDPAAALQVVAGSSTATSTLTSTTTPAP
ncbi:MAG TPA: C40 family peptidase, partial [Pseudonocardia sp.]|nr:C40 family peptidase [Pseudonocardia sp.]